MFGVRLKKNKICPFFLPIIDFATFFFLNNLKRERKKERKMEGKKIQEMERNALRDELIKRGIYPFTREEKIGMIDRYLLNEEKNLIALGSMLFDETTIVEKFRKMKEKVNEVAFKVEKDYGLRNFMKMEYVTAHVFTLNTPRKDYGVGGMQLQSMHPFMDRPGDELEKFYFIAGCYLSILMMIYLPDEITDESMLLTFMIDQRKMDSFMKFIGANYNVRHSQAIIRLPFVIYGSMTGMIKRDTVIVPVLLFWLNFDFFEKNVYMFSDPVSAFKTLADQDVLHYRTSTGESLRTWSLFYSDKRTISTSEIFFYTMIAIQQRHLFRCFIVSQTTTADKGGTLPVSGLKAKFSGSIRRTSDRVLNSLKSQANETTSGAEYVYHLAVESAVYSAEIPELFGFHREKFPVEFWYKWFKDEEMTTIDQRAEFFQGLWRILHSLCTYIHNQWNSNYFWLTRIEPDHKVVQEFDVFNRFSFFSLGKEYRPVIKRDQGCLILANFIYPLIRRFPVFKKPKLPYDYADMSLLGYVMGHELYYKIAEMTHLGDVYSKKRNQEILDRMTKHDLWKLKPEFTSKRETKEGPYEKEPSEEKTFFSSEPNLIAKYDYKFRSKKMLEDSSKVVDPEIPEYAALVDDMIFLILENPALFTTLISLIPFVPYEELNRVNYIGMKPVRPLGSEFISTKHIEVLEKMILYSFENKYQAQAMTFKLLEKAFYNMFRTPFEPIWTEMIEKEVKRTKGEYKIVSESLIDQGRRILLYTILHGKKIDADSIYSSIMEKNVVFFPH